MFFGGRQRYASQDDYKRLQRVKRAPNQIMSLTRTREDEVLAQTAPDGALCSKICFVSGLFCPSAWAVAMLCDAPHPRITAQAF